MSKKENGKPVNSGAVGKKAIRMQKGNNTTPKNPTAFLGRMLSKHFKVGMTAYRRRFGAGDRIPPVAVREK